MSEMPRGSTRRDWLSSALQVAGAVGLGGLAAAVLTRVGRGASRTEYRWQLDPHKCIQCGRCATECVLNPSAVKCIHSYAMCGYCKLCTGYFQPQPAALHSGAENQLCPVGAIQRSFVEDPYYEYTIDHALCIGCGKCVAGCGQFGNGSLYLQVLHDRCVNCNECNIARNCPADAFRRVGVDEPYLLKIRPGTEDGPA
jgi:electron transport complex protein RnfB